MSETTESSDEMILVRKAEYERLKKLEGELPAVIAKTKEERDRERLKELSQRHKDNPDEHRQKALKRYYKNKEEINAKRREAYKNKKDAEKINASQ
jgi:hypothetical protein